MFGSSLCYIPRRRGGMARKGRIRLEDGRHAERHVIDHGDGTTTTELHVEAPKTYQLATRITERTKPVVVERTVEHLDAEGRVVSQNTEPGPVPALVEFQAEADD